MELDKQDEREIEFIKQFAKELEKQIEQVKDLSYEERIKLYLKSWKE